VIDDLDDCEIQRANSNSYHAQAMAPMRERVRCCTKRSAKSVIRNLFKFNVCQAIFDQVVVVLYDDILQKERAREIRSSAKEQIRIPSRLSFCPG
jgi:hypothetical protein